MVQSIGPSLQFAGKTIRRDSDPDAAELDGRGGSRSRRDIFALGNDHYVSSATAREPEGVNLTDRSLSNVKFSPTNLTETVLEDGRPRPERIEDYPPKI